MLFSPEVKAQRVASLELSLNQDNLFSLSGKTSHSSLEKSDDFTQLLEALKFANDFIVQNPDVLLYIPANLNKKSVVTNTLTSILRCRLETSKDWFINQKELESKGETIWTKTNCFGNMFVQLEFNEMLKRVRDI